MTRLLFAALAVFALGCNAIAGINEPISEDGPNAAPTATTPSGPKDLSLFIGKWTNTGGRLTASCPSTGPQVHDTYGDLTIVKGDASDLVATDDEGCMYKLNVSGGTASLLPNQSCESQGNTYRYSTGTFTVDPGGRTANAVITGDADVYDQISGTTMRCQFELNNPFTKD